MTRILGYAALALGCARGVSYCAEPNVDSFGSAGLSYFTAQNYHAALTNFTRVTELNPRIADAWCFRGMCEYWLADYRGAISNYDRAIELNPACSGYYCNRGQSKFELGETSAALADYNRAIQLDPKNAQAYLNRGTLKACAQTNLTDAVADFTKAIEAHTDPQEYEIFFVRGNAKKELKDFTGAVADYTKALQLNPKYEPARTNLAIAQNALHGRKEK